MRRTHLLLALASLTACDGEVEDTDVFVPDFNVRPGVEQVTVLDAEPGAVLTLYNSSDEALLAITANERGQAHFAYIPSDFTTLAAGERFTLSEGITLQAGSDYTIVDDSGRTSGPFDVLDVDDVEPLRPYEEQVLTGIHSSPLTGDDGDPLDAFQFIETRDGTLLSAMVRFPDPLLYGEGPYPTVIEYSGYSPSRPDRPDSGSFIANALGFATVGVNMRGTGCSGGVFDVFNKAQQADGYDIVEVVARQEWVLHNHVGMVGLSYPGISELYTASTNPPSLAAAVPLSVLADPWEMQWPGGIYNQGFTRQWVAEREAQAAANGSSWVVDLIDGGNDTCAKNVEMSDLSVDFESFLRALEYREPQSDDRDLNLLVEQIEAPMFFGGQFQDEQTGAQWGAMTDRFVRSPHSRFLLSNGRHPDGYAPDAVFRWFEFLEFYVAKRIPVLNGPLRLVGGPEFADSFGFDEYEFPEDRFTEYDSYEAALAAYQAEDPVTLLFENGYGDPAQSGAPFARFSTTLDSWPPAEELTEPLTWYLDDGALADEAPSSEASDAYAFDPEAGATTFFGDNHYSTLALHWNLDWSHFAAGDAVAYVSDAFTDDTVLLGPGIAEVWVRSPVDDVQLQITLTEIRPNNEEVLVQTGWLRMGHRLATTGDDLRLERTYAELDFEPVPVNEWTRADVQIPSIAHPMRAGSRLQFEISSPGRNHGTWEFEAPVYDGTPSFEIGRGGAHASRIELRTMDGLDIPAEYPACDGLRGQPCRTWVPRTNSQPSDSAE